MTDAAKEAAQVLEDAADLLLANGRCILTGVRRGGTTEDVVERYCVLGAIAKAQGVDPDDWPQLFGDPAVDALGKHLMPAVIDWWASQPQRPAEVTPIMTVYTWNDCLIGDDDGDDFDVIDTLRLVAKDLRNEAAES